MMNKSMEDGLAVRTEHRTCTCLIDPEARHWLMLLTGEDGMQEAGEILKETRKLAPAQPVNTVIVPVLDWNTELSPWDAPALFKGQAFGHGAPEMLREILEIRGRCCAAQVPWILAGYSLAGLFALWSACETDGFDHIAAVSPSVWFPGWDTYAHSHECLAQRVYLSLGEKEARTRNPQTSMVAERIEQERDLLMRRGIACTLEWNPGNHFQDHTGRMARGIAWLLNQEH